MAKIIIVHGAPGSGKTSNCSLMKEQEPGRFNHISIGNRLRAIRTGKTLSQFKDEIDKQAQTLSQSEPLSHDLVNAVIFEFVNACPTLGAILIDGYPRFLDQLSIFYASLNKGDHECLGLIHLQVLENISQERLTTRGNRVGEREIDPAFSQKRFRAYQTHTIPTINNLSVVLPVKEVNANQSMEKVSTSFYAAVISLMR